MSFISQLFGADYYEVAADTPLVINVTTTPRGVLGNATYKWVLSYIIKVRTMGTATYISVGNVDGQGYRLTVKGETYGYACNPKEVCDLSRVYLVSDTNDSYVELVAAYIPTPMQGDVELSNRSF